MNETVYSIGEFPGHEVLTQILDEGPMPDRPGEKGTVLNRNHLDRYIAALQQILKDSGYPITSMELDALIDEDDKSLAMPFTLLLRLAHQTRSAWYAGEIGKFGHYMGQLAKVTAEAKYYEKLSFTISGMKVYAGARKSALARANLKQLKPSHEKILQLGKNMLALDYPRNELTSRIHRRISGKDGFPSSIRQYSAILKPLRAAKKKSEA